MPPLEFEPTIAAGEQPKTYALDRAATGIGNSKMYIEQILATFYENLSNQDREYGFFLQGAAALKTVCNSMTVLQSICGDRIILFFVACSLARSNPIGQLCVRGNLKDTT